MEPNQVISMELDSAIASILGRTNHPSYVKLKYTMKVQELYKLLGLSGSPMLYKYMSGQTKSIEPERALVLYDKMGILLSQWDDRESIEAQINSDTLGATIANEPIKKVVEELVEIEADNDTYDTLRRGVRGLIFKHY